MTYEKNLIDRITYHLSSGGLFNPELADHLAVRNLLMECREALAQPEQEPWVCECGADSHLACKCAIKSSPQRKPLTDEALKPLIQKAMMYYGHNPDHWTVTAGAGFCILARAIEAAHGIKGEA